MGRREKILKKIEEHIKTKKSRANRPKFNPKVKEIVKSH